MDMYTRVKRERRHVKRDMYGIPINEDSKDKTATSSDNSETESKLLCCWCMKCFSCNCNLCNHFFCLSDLPSLDE